MGVYRRSDRHSKNRIYWISYIKDGCQHRESSGSTNKTVAKRLLALRTAQVLEDRWNLPRSHSPQFEKWTQEFIKSITHARTKSRYQSSINNLQKYFGKKIRLSEITPESIFLFQQKRLQDGAGKATVNRDTATLSSCLSRAKRMRFISRNPCKDIERLNERRERRQARPLSYEEEALVKKFAPLWLSVLITVLAETGLRVRKEALPLKWSDVVLDDNPAHIRVCDSKSAAGVRTVWLTSHCRLELLKWRSVFGPTFSPHVFPSPRIPGASITDYKTAWRTAARKAGLADRQIYDLRSTFASRANTCSTSALTLAQLLGHASTQILPTYVKPLDENTKAIIEGLNAARNLHSAQTRSVQ
ncbi:MAG TPA: tyrosine-type recombinase/integrase [Candidatus Sulfotelmatobacter sp.]|nr:tyrosine-type recombinase/integrase [Candidatus Sulfotelmatobacter sp.]